MTAPAPLDLPALLDDLERAHEEWRTDDGLDVATTDGRVWNALFRRPRWMDADDVRRLVAEHNAVPTLIAELRKRDAAPSPAAEPPHDLREALAEWLFRYNRGPLTFWHEISEVAKDSRRDDADQLLAGPLAPLLDRLTRAEAAHRHIAAIAAANPGSKGTHYADAARILTAALSPESVQS